MQFTDDAILCGPARLLLEQRGGALKTTPDIRAAMTHHVKMAGKSKTLTRQVAHLGRQYTLRILRAL